jgi:hypothetical protein
MSTFSDRVVKPLFMAEEGRPVNWLRSRDQETGSDVPMPSSRPRFPKQMLPYWNEWELSTLLKVRTVDCPIAGLVVSKSSRRSSTLPILL